MERNEDKLKLRKPTTNQKMLIGEYVVQWQEWIKKERLFLIDEKNKIQSSQSNQSIQDFIFNIDEIPMYCNPISHENN